VGVGFVVIAASNQGFGDYYYYVGDEFAAFGGTAAVLYSISAYVGFRKTKRCRQAMEHLRASLPEMNNGGIEPVIWGMLHKTS
jgi:hypothetical protein